MLFVTFMLAGASTTTGIPLHEWLGLVIFAPLFFHVIWRWKWVVRVFKPSNRKRPGQTTFAKWFNLALFFTMLPIGGSGLMISGALLPLLS